MSWGGSEVRNQFTLFIIYFFGSRLLTAYSAERRNPGAVFDARATRPPVRRERRVSGLDSPELESGICEGFKTVATANLPQ